MDNITFIFQTNGTYMGFAENNYVFSRDGNYLGWVENDNSVYDRSGIYRGKLSQINDHYYILKNRFVLDPLPKPPTKMPAPHQPLPPQSNIAAIAPDLGLVDSFRVWGVS